MIVFDNASPDDTPAMVECEFPTARLIRGDANLGFAGGNNRALAVRTGQYVMLLNPDAELLPGTLETCLDYLEAHPEVAVVAPKLLNPDGSLQFSLRNFPTVRNTLFEALFLHRLFPQATPQAAEMIVDSRYYDGERRVQWASGAAFVTRSEVFERVGELDDSFFLYSEETDWFARLAENDLSAVYLPQAAVVHRSPEGRNPDLMRYAVRSRLLYARKHLSVFSAGIVWAVLSVGMAARMIAWSAIALGGSGSASERSKAYRIGLRAAIRPEVAPRV
jgi:GT2 family glycosyltransferase